MPHRVHLQTTMTAITWSSKHKNSSGTNQEECYRQAHPAKCDIVASCIECQTCQQNDDHATTNTTALVICTSIYTLHRQITTSRACCR